jgi:hypothetical protein
MTLAQPEIANMRLSVAKMEFCLMVLVMDGGTLHVWRRLARAEDSSEGTGTAFYSGPLDPSPGSWYRHTFLPAASRSALSVSQW